MSCEFNLCNNGTNMSYKKLSKTIVRPFKHRKIVLLTSIIELCVDNLKKKPRKLKV